MVDGRQLPYWKAIKHPMGDWGIFSDDGEFICNGLRHWNKDLILAAVNACLQVNPDNPLAVAQTIKEAFEALKQAEEWFQTHSNSPTGLFAQQLIHKVLAKAIAKAEGK